MPTHSSQSGRSQQTSLSLAAMFACSLSLMTGCQQQVSRDELGTVVFKTAELPGADQPYTRPEMATPTPPPPTDDILPGAIDELR